MQPIQIRKARSDEADRLAEIAYDAWETGIYPLLAEGPGARQSERRRLTQAVHQTLDLIIVAEAQGEVLGWCSRQRGRPYIPFLFVDPEFQGRGVGSQLLRRMESMLELEGEQRVHLETPADNVRAVRFYERQGYRILAMKPDGRIGAHPLLSVRLEKRLSPFRGPISDSE
jgi:2-amino-4-hydroxy-6-hydroxymethyldihydropteridine diphosphokinase